MLLGREGQHRLGLHVRRGALRRGGIGCGGLTVLQCCWQVSGAGGGVGWQGGAEWSLRGCGTA